MAVDEKGRATEIVRRLKNAYGSPKTALVHNNALELLIATILSAQCTDKRVNIVTEGLFKKYKTARNYAGADIHSLEQDVRSTGFYRNKAKNIIGAARVIQDKFGGKVPDTMGNLLTLPGVARKTANVVLSSWFGKDEGIVVDTHVRRLTGLLGLTRNTDPEKIEKDLMSALPQKDWKAFSFLLIDHGRSVCIARRPKCSECVLKDLCPSAKK